MGGKGAKVHAEARIAKIAKRQHGVISISQLRMVGVGEKGVRSRLAAARLHRVHRGVYAVGHVALSPEARCLAAVLAVGRGPSGEAGTVLDYWRAAVSHRSAVGLWGLLTVRDGPIDVIVEGNGGRRGRSGIRVHRSLTLTSADVTVSRGIPVTTPARTISDLQKAIWQSSPGAITDRELRKAIRQANVLGLPLDEEDGRDRRRSDLEGDFLRICRRHRLPPPEINVRLGRHLVDFLWRERRLVVETDSYLYHGGKVAFQDDRGRDLDLRRLGYDILRLSEWQINEEPDLVVETLTGALRPCRRDVLRAMDDASAWSTESRRPRPRLGDPSHGSRLAGD